jgi:hypothetical protein
VRKVLKKAPAYRRFAESGKTGVTVDFLVDAVVFPSPYALSFGGFVELATSMWFGGGGLIGSLWNTLGKLQKPAPKDTELAGEALPEDMSTLSLVGGGLIAGDSLAALGFGLSILLSKLVGG